MKQAYRLNKKYSSEYALFVVDREKELVEFRRFNYYGGDTLEEKTFSLGAGKQLYSDMLHEITSGRPWAEGNNRGRTWNTWVVAGPQRKGKRQ